MDIFCWGLVKTSNIPVPFPNVIPVSFYAVQLFTQQLLQYGDARILIWRTFTV